MTIIPFANLYIALLRNPNPKQQGGYIATAPTRTEAIARVISKYYQDQLNILVLCN